MGLGSHAPQLIHSSVIIIAIAYVFIKFALTKQNKTFYSQIIMEIEKRINAFCELGKFFNQFASNEEKDSIVFNNDSFYNDFKQNLEFSSIKNQWFTKENLRFSLENWASALTKENLTKWLDSNSLTRIQKSCNNYCRKYSFGWLS